MGQLQRSWAANVRRNRSQTREWVRDAEHGMRTEQHYAVPASRGFGCGQAGAPDRSWYKHLAQNHAFEAPCGQLGGVGAYCVRGLVLWQCGGGTRIDGHGPTVHRCRQEFDDAISDGGVVNEGDSSSTSQFGFVLSRRGGKDRPHGGNVGGREPSLLHFDDLDLFGRDANSAAAVAAGQRRVAPVGADSASAAGGGSVLAVLLSDWLP